MQRNFCLFSVTSRGRTAYYYNDLMRGVSSLVMKYSMAERKLTDMSSGCCLLQKAEYMRQISAGNCIFTAAFDVGANTFSFSKNGITVECDIDKAIELLKGQKSRCYEERDYAFEEALRQADTLKTSAPQMVM
jgi:hypothetical protein